MALADYIDLSGTWPRAIVRLHDNDASYYYYAQHYMTMSGSNTLYAGKIKSISPFDFVTSDQGMVLTTCDIELIDTDQVIENLDITMEWQVRVSLGFVGDTYANALDWDFDLAAPPQYSNGICRLSCIVPVNRLCGEIRLPTIDRTDIDSFSAITSGAGYNTQALVGWRPPIYWGNHEAPGGAIEAVKGSTDGTVYYFAITSDDDADTDYTTSDVDVFLNGKEIDTYSVGSESLSGDGAPANWKLWYIGLANRADGSGVDFQISPDDTLRVNARLPLPSGEDLYTPALTIKTLLDHWAVDSSDSAPGTSAYNNWEDAHDRLQAGGISSRLIIDKNISMATLIDTIIKDTGCEIQIGHTGRINFRHYSNDDATETTGGYSSEESRSDEVHMLSFDRVDKDQANSVVANGLLMTDSVAKSAASDAVMSLSYENLEPSAAYLAAWRKLQEVRDTEHARVFQVALPLTDVDIMPDTIRLFTERWVGLSDAPARCISASFDLQNMIVNCTFQDLSAWTDTNAYILIDENSVEVTYPNGINPASDTLDILAASGVVEMNGGADGSAGDIAVGDIMRIYSDDNDYSAAVTIAPSWTGTVWQMTVDDNALSDETVSAGEWDTLKSYDNVSSAIQASSGFVAGSDDTLGSGSDPGKKVMM